jgi:hypothetical protein
MKKREKKISAPNWIKWGTCGSYSVWYYGTTGTTVQAVWNVTAGDPPKNSSFAGYYTLDGALKVRGFTLDMCQQIGSHSL